MKNIILISIYILFSSGQIQFINSQPENIPDWKSFMHSPKMQSGPYCAAYACAGVAEGLFHYACYKRNIHFDYSKGINLDESILISQTGDECYDGAGCFSAISQGIPSRGDTFPNFDHASYKIRSYSIVSPTSIDIIKEQLHYSPVWASMDSYSDFHSYTGGVYKHKPDSASYPRGHAVVILGYNDAEKYWICKNSWDTTWGEKGYFRIAYGQCCIDSRISIACSIDDNCFAKIVPEFFSLDYILSNQDKVSGNEYVYVLDNQTLTKDYPPLRGSVNLHIASGASIDLNGHQLTAIGSSPLLGCGGITVEKAGAIKNCAAEVHRTDNGSIAGYYPGVLGNIYLYSDISYRFVVLPSCTVNVLAGSIFRFYNSGGTANGSFYFEICGTFNAVGSPSNPITFDFMSAVPGCCSGIRFQSGSSGNIQFALIYTKDPDKVILYDSSSNVLLNNVTYKLNAGPGCKCDSSPALAGYQMHANYPNPFNSVTRLSYSIPDCQNVKVTIYDLLGREVFIIINEYKSAGDHTIRFDGTSLPSGNYICTIQAGQFIASKKIMLLK